MAAHCEKSGEWSIARATTMSGAGGSPISSCSPEGTADEAGVAHPRRGVGPILRERIGPLLLVSWEAGRWGDRLSCRPPSKAVEPEQETDPLTPPGCFNGNRVGRRMVVSS